MKKNICITYRGIYVLLSGFALLMWLGIISGNYMLEDVVYYSTQSNILCFIFFTFYFIYGIVKKDLQEPANPLPRIKGAITLCIIVTGLLFVLLPGPEHVSLASAILHYICPIMVLLDYFLFDKKGSFNIYDPFLWLIIPIAYVIFALVRGFLGNEIGNTGSNYPYPFLDPTPTGAGSGIFIYIGAMVIGFLLLGYVIFVLDRLLSKKRYNA